MPVNLSNRTTESAEARIEIIPLIDIMFFLLAAFMLVSLSMVTSRSVKVDLPTATTGAPDSQSSAIGLSIDAAGTLFLERNPIGNHELLALLIRHRETNPAVRVFLSGDRSARHGDVMRALDLVRSAGVDRIAFETREPSEGKAP